tara:strand:+ start:1519 stop:2076 length:558 start_codon:yes stop_codon:yes gene_type:complete
MSNVEDVLNDIDTNVAYYSPDLDTSGKKFATIDEGTYEATVSKLAIKKDIVVKNKYLSDIFEASYVLEDERYPDLKGREVKSKGYFRFKAPDKTKYPNLEDNQGNNKGYMIFSEACGFEMKKDKEGRYLLPMVMESDIAGNPVTIKVVHDKWTDQSGEERITPVAINVFKSKTREKSMTEDELPF